jgi:hypothetical protein
MKELRIEAVYNHEYEKDRLIEVLIKEFPDSTIYVNTDLVHVPDDK